METLVLVMMILVCFSFVLKQTFHGVKEIMIISVLVAFFVGMTWPLAIEQSKTQIAAWIADQKLMLDMAVLLSIDVALTMLFCVHHVDLKTSEHVSRRKWVFFIFLKYFPGLLVFPVLFSVLVMTIFLLPGVSFQVVAWVLDAGIHLWFEMALAGATNPLGTAFSGRGAARIDGHHRYGEWQDCGGRIQQFRCPLASRRYRHRHRRNGDRMGNLQLSN